MIPKIKTIKEKIAYSEEKNPWVKLYFNEVEFPNGQKGCYNKIVEVDGKGGVVVVPIYKDKIGLIKQYRYPVDKFLIEVPRGFSESYDLVENVIRELKEETGIVIEKDRIIDLGTVYPNSGLLSSEINLFAVKLKSKSNERMILGKEPTDFKWYTKVQVEKMIKNNEICDAFTLCAIFRALLKGII
jgi:ADP-ribose pyrophosphatase